MRAGRGTLVHHSDSRHQLILIGQLELRGEVVEGLLLGPVTSDTVTDGPTCWQSQSDRRHGVTYPLCLQQLVDLQRPSIRASKGIDTILGPRFSP